MPNTPFSEDGIVQGKDFVGWKHGSEDRELIFLYSLADRNEGSMTCISKGDETAFFSALMKWYMLSPIRILGSAPRLNTPESTVNKSFEIEKPASSTFFLMALISNFPVSLNVSRKEDDSRSVSTLSIKSSASRLVKMDLAHSAQVNPLACKVARLI